MPQCLSNAASLILQRNAIHGGGVGNAYFAQSMHFLRQPQKRRKMCAFRYYYYYCVIVVRVKNAK